MDKKQISNVLSENTINKLVSERLKLIRMEYQLSQKDLADLTSVTVQQIQKYEKGINRISPGKLYMIACKLNVNIDYFFPMKEKFNPSLNLYRLQFEEAINKMSALNTQKLICEFITNLFSKI